jgi:hypothetical protein
MEDSFMVRVKELDKEIINSLIRQTCSGPKSMTEQDDNFIAGLDVIENERKAYEYRRNNPITPGIVYAPYMPLLIHQ